MGSGDHGDGQVLQVSISAFWVSGAPGFDQRLHDVLRTTRRRHTPGRTSVMVPLTPEIVVTE